MKGGVFHPLSVTLFLLCFRDARVRFSGREQKQQTKANVMNTIIRKGDYTFICSWRSNRSGFVHEVKLFNTDNYCLATAKCQYYNRTWESYEYQTCMRNAVTNAIATRKEQIKQELIRELGSVRTNKGKDALNKVVESDDNLLRLADLSFLVGL